MSIFEVIWIACCMIALLFFAVYEVIMDHRRFVIDVDGVLYEYVRIDYSPFGNEITVFDEYYHYEYKIRYSKIIIYNSCWKSKVPPREIHTEENNEESVFYSND